MNSQYEHDRITSNLVIEMHSLLHDRKQLEQVRENRAAQNFRIQVRLQMKNKNWSQVDLAVAARISPARINQILSDKHGTPNITLKTFNRIAWALDCSLDVKLNTFMGQQLSRPVKPLPSFKEEMMNL